MATRRKPLSPTELAEANVRQLRAEANLSLMKVSAAIKELQEYTEAHQNDDYLVRGFENTPKKNPFRKKKLNSCSLF